MLLTLRVRHDRDDLPVDRELRRHFAAGVIANADDGRHRHAGVHVVRVLDPVIHAFRQTRDDNRLDRLARVGLIRDVVNRGQRPLDNGHHRAGETNGVVVARRQRTLADRVVADIIALCACQRAS